MGISSWFINQQTLVGGDWNRNLMSSSVGMVSGDLEMNWLVVWNHGIVNDFPFSWEIFIPTDELHHFSQG